MSNPNPERDERVKRCPERVFIELDDNGDYHASPRGFHDAEYIRADIAATRMRDRCVEKVRDAIHDLSRTAIAAEQNARGIDALIKLREELKSLTLEEKEGNNESAVED